VVAPAEKKKEKKKKKKNMKASWRWEAIGVGDIQRPQQVST
jgi:hypothetical protein